jgi:preprotein translocase subunit SecF
MSKETPTEITHISVNQTLSRTIMTGVTTLMVLSALFFLGGEIIHGFALALIVGVVIGTFSSIYIASPLVLSLGLTREDLLAVKKEDAEVDTLP